MPPLPDPETVKQAVLPFLAPQVLLFLTFGFGALVTAIAMVLHTNPIRSALFLVLNLFGVAVLYLLLHAYFLAAVQVIVYAGAIMVLFLFVIMLLNLGSPDRTKDVLRWQQPVAVGGGLVLALVLSVSVFATQSLPRLDAQGKAPVRLVPTAPTGMQAMEAQGISPEGMPVPTPVPAPGGGGGGAASSPPGLPAEEEPVSKAADLPVEEQGTVRGIGLNLYDPRQPWLFPFEATSILLLVAVLGSVVLSKRRMPGESLAGSRAAEAGLAAASTADSAVVPGETLPGGKA